MSYRRVLGSQTGTLGNLIDRLSPALLSLFYGLQRGGNLSATKAQ